MATDPNRKERPWLKSYSSWMPSTLAYPRVPLYHFLQESAARYPNRPAIIYQDPSEGGEPVVKTYRQLDEESGRFAAGLVSLGVSRGARVAYYIQNSPELIAGFYGILKAGAVPVPCNVMYQAEELAYHLNDSGAKVLLCESPPLPYSRPGSCRYAGGGRYRSRRQGGRGSSLLGQPLGVGESPDRISSHRR